MKQKIPKSVTDRFKITKTGKVLRRKIGTRHLKSSKSKANIRRGKHYIEVLGPTKVKIKKLLGIKKR